MKKLIPDDALAKATHLRRNNPLLPLLTRVAGIDRVNELYALLEVHEGDDFIAAFFRQMELEIVLNESHLKEIPASGPFIVISNHPFGALDGLALLHVVRKVRPDFRMMANFLLQQIDPLRDCFIGVNPFENLRDRSSSHSGMKLALQHLSEGHGLGIFPAGEVSTLYKDLRKVADRQWQLSAIKLIRKARVPVIPVYFDGSNSYLFHLIGKIHPGLRTLSLPAEMFRKKGTSIHLTIGHCITPVETDVLSSAQSYGRYLRAKTYATGSAMEVRKSYFKILKKRKRTDPIDAPVPDEQLKDEINGLDAFRVMRQDPFEVYIISSRQAPLCLKEIGRLRELTFREIGEGTNRHTDLDEFDLYYDHLVLWDSKEKKIAGAYRLGNGAEIMERYGLQGFYTHTLFRMHYRMKAILRNSLELGRSFITPEYQKHRLPLFLLWKGILHYLSSKKHFRYIIGPVSISNAYQDVSKSLMIQFIRQNYFDAHLSRYVQPRHEYRPKATRVDTGVLLEAAQQDIRRLDKMIAEIEPMHFTMPVLLKRYLQQNARILAFNSDPKFNHALDGLMLLDIKDLPSDTVENLQRDMFASTTEK